MTGVRVRTLLSVVQFTVIKQAEAFNFFFFFLTFIIILLFSSGHFFIYKPRGRAARAARVQTQEAPPTRRAAFS